MPRRLATAIVTAMVVALGGASSALADQATLLDFVEPIPPGETATWTFTLVVAGAGIPNVAYENAESFAAGETVTATITPIVEPAGFGTVELVGSGTLTGTASDDWNTGENGELGEIIFGPELSLRYTAPSLGDLGCTDHPGETFRGHVGVLADFSGETGTLAHVPTHYWAGRDGSVRPSPSSSPVHRRSQHRLPQILQTSRLRRPIPRRQPLRQEKPGRSGQYSRSW